VLYQRPGLGGDLRKTGHAAARRARIGIDAGKPWDQSATEQCQSRLLVLRHFGVSVRSLERALNRGLDRALHAAELFVLL